MLEGSLVLVLPWTQNFFQLSLYLHVAVQRSENGHLLYQILFKCYLPVEGSPDNDCRCWLTFRQAERRSSYLTLKITSAQVVETSINNVNLYIKYFIYWTADVKSCKLWSSQLWMQFMQLRMEAWKSQDFKYRCDALTNWAMKPLTLGAGNLWLLMSPWRMDVKWYMKG